MTAALILIGGALQLTVPSYALRLIRRYGVERVGWFVLTAFASLALLRLVGPLKPIASWQAMPDAMPDFTYIIGSVLLLIGMGHLEALFAERERAHVGERNIANNCEAITEDISDLAKTNQELLAELARRDQIEKALLESEAQYRLVFTENPQPMWIFDVRSSRFLAVNNAALRQYGFTPQEFSALTVRDLLPGAAVGKFLEYVGKACTGTESRGHWQHYKKDGTSIDVEISATDITCAGTSARLVLAEDVSERRQREFASRQAQKMEFIGRVAGGVAHHFNNMLTVVQGYTSVLQKRLNEPTTVEHLNHIAKATTRAASLANQLLIAGARHPAMLEPLDLNALIRNQIQPLQRVVGDRIVLENTCGSFLAPVVADQYLVEYVLLNLVTNARDAMQKGGTITISTATLRLDETQVRGNHDAKAGEFVRLVVSDTGCGMSPDVQARLFEPFATTKEIGKGTGLGLAGVYGAVKQMSGWIETTSDVGVGTQIRVFLPVAPAAEVLARLQAKAAAPVVKGTVLLVEPEDKMRGLARCVLNWNDYKVIEADNSETALVLWNSQASRVDLLLTDINLPGELSGRDLAERLQKAKPGLKVMYTSASSVDEELPCPAVPEDLKYIPKPYTPSKLIQAVQSCLSCNS